VAKYVRARYAPLAMLGDVQGPGGVRLLRLASQPVTPADDVTGWPCRHRRR
jgi:hypothetical protein